MMMARAAALKAHAAAQRLISCPGVIPIKQRLLTTIVEKCAALDAPVREGARAFQDELGGTNTVTVPVAAFPKGSVA